MEALTIKVHSRKQNTPEVFTKNVKCDKCNSQVTSKMSLSQHMFTTHTPTRIEETGIFCNLCGEEFWTELTMIQHLKEHINGRKTDEPFFCKLCGIGIHDKNAINQHMKNHVESVLKEDMEEKKFQKEVVQKLATISESEDETKSNTETDKEEEDNEEELIMDDSELYAGFDEDGNRIVEDDHDES